MWFSFTYKNFGGRIYGAFSFLEKSPGQTVPTLSESVRHPSVA